MPIALEIPIELLVLALRLLLLLVIYGFLLAIIREVRRDLSRPPTRTEVPSFASLVVVRSGDPSVDVGERFELTHPSTIGRAPDVAIRINEHHVSGHHAEVTWKNTAWRLRDTGSTNGTLLNGSPVATEQQLSPGDTIEVGTVALRFEVNG